MRSSITNNFKFALILLGFMMFFMPRIGYCLGFGPIKLYSYMNDPMDAEIELLGAEDIDTGQLVATLASSQDFKKADMARPYFLTKLRFEVTQQNNRHFIHVTSDEPIKQPYVEFLVVLGWPEGRLVRGYTALLDPAPMGGAYKREVMKHPEPRVIMGDGVISSHYSRDGVSQAIQYLNPNKMDKPAENAFDQANPEIPASSIPKEVAVSNFEPLFDAEAEEGDLESENGPLPLLADKPAVRAIDNNAVEIINETAQGVDSSSVTREVVGSSPKASNVSEAYPAGSNENRLLLASGLALLFAIGFSVWVLLRARATLPTKVEEQIITPPLSRAEEMLAVIEESDEEIGLKINLAQQYNEINDTESAREILDEVVMRGNKKEQETARHLLKQWAVR